jgi:hypothetical protein
MDRFRFDNLVRSIGSASSRRRPWRRGAHHTSAEEFAVDADRLAAVIRSFSSLPSRRDLLRGFGAVGIGLGALRLPHVAEARKKHKVSNKKRKKKQHTPPQPIFNRFDCAAIGQPCLGDNTLCCSGVCEGAAPVKGKPDTRVCAAHNAAVCTPESNMCTQGTSVFCNPNHPLSVCVLTTGDAGFCADLTANGRGLCRICTKDTDCQAEFGAGAACVVLGSACSTVCPATGGTACLPPGV